MNIHILPPLQSAKWSRILHFFFMLVVGFILGSQASEFLVIRQDQKAREMHRLDSLNLLSYVTIMIIIVCTVWFFKHKRVRFLHDFFHETGLAIIYGLIVGAIIRYSGSDSKVSQMSVIPRNYSQINLTSDAPPDMLWIVFQVPKVIWSWPLPNYHLTVTNDTRSTESRSYAYVFKGELFNPETDSQIPHNKHFSEKATFDPEIFFNLILPLIVFNAGYSLKKKSFFRNLGAIIVYAFIGTAISCFVVGLVLYLVKYLMPVTMKEFNLADCFYFGAIISATDPVTVLAIFTDLRVDVKLNALVFGESIFNDVVSIVLASLIEKFKEHIQAGFFYAISHAATNFLNIFVCSLIQGSFFGCITALLTKHTRLYDHPLLESSLFLLMSYASFLLAEVLELSGIVSVLFCGICQAHYTYNNLNQESRVRTKSLFAIANFIAENFIFAYIGVSMFTFPQHLWNTGFILTTFVAVILGRALNIYPLSYLLNLGRTNKIPIEFQHILFFSGLRGAMAFALAIRNTLTAPRRLMLTATSMVSITSVIFCGCTIQPLLHYFQISTNVDDNTGEDGQGPHNGGQGFNGLRQRSDSISSELITPTDDLSVTNSRTFPEYKNSYEKAWLVRKWYDFDVNFMKPLLTHSRPSLMETMPQFCLPIARLLTSSQQMSGKDFLGAEADQKMDIMYLNNDLHHDQMNGHHPTVSHEDIKLNPYIQRKNYFDYNGLQNNNFRKTTGATTSSSYSAAVQEITPTMLTSSNSHRFSFSFNNKSQNNKSSNQNNSISFSSDNASTTAASNDIESSAPIIATSSPTSTTISSSNVSSVVLNPEPLLKQLQ